MTLAFSGASAGSRFDISITGRRRKPHAARVGHGPQWALQYSRRLMSEDAVVLLATVVLAYLFSAGTGLGIRQEFAPGYAVGALALAAAWFVALTAARTRDRRVVGMGPAEYTRVFMSSLQFFGIVVVAAYVLELTIAREFLAIAFVVGCALLLTNRYRSRQWLSRERLEGRCTTAVVVLGPPESAKDLIRTLERDAAAGLRVVGVCVPSTTDPTLSSVLGVPVLGDLVDVPAVATAALADIVAVTGSDAVTPGVVRQLGWDLESTGIDLVMAPALTDIAGPRVVTQPVNGASLLHVDAPQFTGAKYWAKAAFDGLLTGLVTLLLAPVMLVVAALVKLSSPGPVIFTQERIGLDGEPFRMLKFRSMYADAEDRLAELSHLSEGNGVLFKLKDDPRITPIGKVLRKFSLDELPQLLNVLRGDMSLVGPRPPLRREVDQYETHVHRRLLVKPGITGLWQVSGRSDLTWEESVRLDLYYTENWSLFGDLLILARTARTVLSPDGAY